MKKKNIFYLLAFVVISLSILAGCQVSGGDNSVKIKLISGKYMTIGNNQELALKVEVDNTGYDKELTVEASDFSLVDNKGEKVIGKSYYSSQDLSSENISKNEKSEGYVYFEARENTKYTLKYEYSKSKKIKVNDISINTSKYRDDTVTLKKAAKAYVSTVFLGKDDSNYEKYIVGDKEDAKSDFRKSLKEEINGHYFNNRMLDKEFIDDFTAKVQSFNAKNSEMKVSIELIDNELVCKVTDRVIDLSNYDTDLNELTEKKLKEKGLAVDPQSEEYDNVRNEAAKELFKDKSDKYFSTNNMKNINRFSIMLTQKGNKWIIPSVEEIESNQLNNIYSGDVNVQYS